MPVPAGWKHASTPDMHFNTDGDVESTPGELHIRALDSHPAETVVGCMRNLS